MKRQKRVTLKDIAEELGMCFTSVSRILRGDQRFNADTVRLVQEKAREMNYRPNIMARALASKGTSFVGLIVNSVAGSFNPMIINGVQDALESDGYSILLGTSRFNSVNERRHLRVMVDKFVDGVIITPATTDHDNQAEYNEVLAQNIPLIIIGQPKPGVDAPIVCVDNVTGGRLVAKHLIYIGHRHLAYITTSIQELNVSTYHERNSVRFFMSENKSRYAGFLSGVKEYGDDSATCSVLDAHGSDGVTEPIVQQLLSLKPLPTAVFCYSDMYAMQLIRLLQSKGIRVPEDISIVGFDDMPLAPLTGPALTTIQQPKYELGMTAALKVLEMINGTRPVDCILQPQLIVRESTCPPKNK